MVRSHLLDPVQIPLISEAVRAETLLMHGTSHTEAGRWRPLARRLASPGAAVWLLSFSLLAAAVALGEPFAVPAQGPLRRDLSIAPLPLWGVFFLCEVAYVQVMFRRQGCSFSLTEIALVLGLWFSGGLTVVLAATAGSGAAFFLHRRNRGLKLWFNLTQVAASTVVAVTVFQAVGAGGDPLQPRAAVATFAATLAAVAVATSAVSLAIALYQGRSEAGKLLVASLGNLAATTVNTCIGLVAVVLVSTSPAAVLLLLPPAAALVAAYGAVILSRRRSESLDFLYQASCILQRGATRTEPMVDLLELARVTLGAEVAELTLYAPGDRLQGLRTSVGPGNEVRRLEPVSTAPEEAARADLSADLEGNQGRIGKLLVAQPSASRRAFSDRDRRLFSTLANHVTVALENGALEASLAKVNALKEELHHRAFHDELTGLANRARFVDALGRAVRSPSSSEGPAVLFVDIDDFKAVNDTFGHAAGDAVLVEVAERLRRCVRPDDLAVRLGGDEFAVLLSGRDAQRAAAGIADRLMAALDAPCAVGGGVLRITASVGIAGADMISSPDELLRKADVAMYHAKRTGKGRWTIFERAALPLAPAAHAG
jgi:diguanylate cyclase (GGDEF)-like protein